MGMFDDDEMVDYHQRSIPKPRLTKEKFERIEQHADAGVCDNYETLRLLCEEIHRLQNIINEMDCNDATCGMTEDAVCSSCALRRRSRMP